MANRARVACAPNDSVRSGANPERHACFVAPAAMRSVLLLLLVGGAEQDDMAFAGTELLRRGSVHQRSIRTQGADGSLASVVWLDVRSRRNGSSSAGGLG